MKTQKRRKGSLFWAQARKKGKESFEKQNAHRFGELEFREVLKRSIDILARFQGIKEREEYIQGYRFFLFKSASNI